MYILGVRVDNLSIKESLQKISGFLSDGRQHYIVLPYSAFWVQAQKDEEFLRILNEADLSLSDGVGPIIASYLLAGEKLKGRVMGVDLILALVAKFSAEHSIFLFGGREGAADDAAAKLSLAQAPLNRAAKIVGTLNGYVSDEEATTAINKSGAEILLVGIGMPKQEKWIYDNLKKMSFVKLAIGVGGAFNSISGRTRRAPRLAQKAGLEWLWRLFTQPKKWKKTWRSVAGFAWLILKLKIQKSK